MTTISTAEQTIQETIVNNTFEYEGNFLKINYLAITLLDLEESAPTVSTECLKINSANHETFYTFFCEHIYKTRSGKKTRESVFLDKDNSILQKIDRFETNKSEQSFIVFANDVTNNLFKVMKNSSKSSGSFFILDAEFNNEEFIVLLKLDPQNGVQLDKSTLTLKKIENMLPQSGERVHKCALIKKKYIEGNINLFVLDLQQKNGETSKFFMSEFLTARALPNNNAKTLAALEIISSSISNKFTNISSAKIENAIDVVFTNDSTVYIPTAVEDILDTLLPDSYPNKDVAIKESQNEIINTYTSKYNDYGLSLVVERDEKKITFTSKNNQIFFRYDKVLNDREVIVDLSGDQIIITIDKSVDISFKKLLK